MWVVATTATKGTGAQAGTAIRRETRHAESFALESDELGLYATIVLQSILIIVLLVYGLR